MFGEKMVEEKGRDQKNAPNISQGIDRGAKKGTEYCTTMFPILHVNMSNLDVFCCLKL